MHGYSSKFHFLELSDSQKATLAQSMFCVIYCKESGVLDPMSLGLQPSDGS